MDELLSFSQLIKSLIQDNEILDIKDAREIVKAINNFSTPIMKVSGIQKH